MKGNKIIELQVGFHENKLRRYQRILTNEYFNDYLFEHQHYNDGAYNITYSRKKPEIKDEEVNKVCDNISLILKNARLNYESDETILATIRDNQLIYGDDIDIWKDIKVWINGVYPKYQGNTLFYEKHSYHSHYLRDGVNEEKLITNEFYHEGDVIGFTIETSNISNRYTAIIHGFNRYKFEVYSTGFEGRYHGYYYFDSFKEVQQFFKEKYNKKLVQKGETITHHYS